MGLLVPAPVSAGPADAQPDTAAGRSRMLVAWLVVTGLGGILALTLVVNMLMPRGPESYAMEDPIAMGPAATLLAQTVPNTAFGNGRVWMVSLDGGLIALANRSPHLGCSMYWQPRESRFIDPCHGQFHHLDGTYDTGLTQRDMLRLPLIAVSPEGEVVARSDGSAQPLSVPPDSRIFVDQGPILDWTAASPANK